MKNILYLRPSDVVTGFSSVVTLFLGYAWALWKIGGYAAAFAASNSQYTFVLAHFDPSFAGRRFLFSVAVLQVILFLLTSQLALGVLLRRGRLFLSAVVVALQLCVPFVIILETDPRLLEPSYLGDSLGGISLAGLVVHTLGTLCLYWDRWTRQEVPENKALVLVSGGCLVFLPLVLEGMLFFGLHKLLALSGWRVFRGVDEAMVVSIPLLEVRHSLWITFFGLVLLLALLGIFNGAQLLLVRRARRLLWSVFYAMPVVLVLVLLSASGQWAWLFLRDLERFGKLLLLEGRWFFALAAALVVAAVMVSGGRGEEVNGSGGGGGRAEGARLSWRGGGGVCGVQVVFLSGLALGAWWLFAFAYGEADGGQAVQVWEVRQSDVAVVVVGPKAVARLEHRFRGPLRYTYCGWHRKDEGDGAIEFRFSSSGELRLLRWRAGTEDEGFEEEARRGLVLAHGSSCLVLPWKGWAPFLKPLDADDDLFFSSSLDGVLVRRVERAFPPGVGHRRGLRCVRYAVQVTESLLEPNEGLFVTEGLSWRHVFWFGRRGRQLLLLGVERGSEDEERTVRLWRVALTPRLAKGGLPEVTAQESLASGERAFGQEVNSEVLEEGPSPRERTMGEEDFGLPYRYWQDQWLFPRVADFVGERFILLQSRDDPPGRSRFFLYDKVSGGVESLPIRGVSAFFVPKSWVPKLVNALQRLVFS